MDGDANAQECNCDFKHRQSKIHSHRQHRDYPHGSLSQRMCHLSNRFSSSCRAAGGVRAGLSRGLLSASLCRQARKDATGAALGKPAWSLFSCSRGLGHLLMPGMLVTGGAWS